MGGRGGRGLVSWVLRGVGLRVRSVAGRIHTFPRGCNARGLCVGEKNAPTFFPILPSAMLRRALLDMARAARVSQAAPPPRERGAGVHLPPPCALRAPPPPLLSLVHASLSHALVSLSPTTRTHTRPVSPDDGDLDRGGPGVREPGAGEDARDRNRGRACGGRPSARRPFRSLSLRRAAPLPSPTHTRRHPSRGEISSPIPHPTRP